MKIQVNVEYRDNPIYHTGSDFVNDPFSFLWRQVEPTSGCAMEMTHPARVDGLQPSRYVWMANDTLAGVDKAAASR